MAIYGELGDFSAVDLVLQAAAGRRTGCLMLKQLEREESALLFFEDGELVHAELGPHQGDAVLREIADWETGNYMLDPTLRAPNGHAQSVAKPISAPRDPRRAAEETSDVSTQEVDFELVSFEAVLDGAMQGLLREPDVDGGFLLLDNGELRSSYLRQDRRDLADLSGPVLQAAKLAGEALRLGTLDQLTVELDHHLVLLIRLRPFVAGVVLRDPTVADEIAQLLRESLLP